MSFRTGLFVAGIVSGLVAGRVAQTTSVQNSQPQPSNPTPQPQNPTPRTNPAPGQQPSPTVQPTQNQPTQNQPGQTQPGQLQPGQVQQPGLTGQAGNRYLRPFAFASPTYETRFNEATQRLGVFEQRMVRSNEMLTRRLGEIRTMAPERQSGALLDLVQQMLQDQAQLNRYLVQARTAWSGDLDPNQIDPNTQQPNQGTPQSPTPGSQTTVPTNPER